MKAFVLWFKTNWKSNVLATVTIVYSAQQFLSAIGAWESHQPANWRSAVISLIVATGLYIVKDADTHSNPAEVQLSAMKNPEAQVAALKQIEVEKVEGGAK
jgi:hypothetical protein